MPLNKHNWPVYHLQSKPICPHCDYAIGIHKYNLENIQLDQNTTILTCPRCDNNFVVDVTAQFKYTTEFFK